MEEACVPYEKIAEWTKPSLRRMAAVRAWEIAVEWYCRSLIGRGSCPKANGRACADCSPYLRRVFDLTGARSPAALARWRARDQAGIANEKFSKLDKTPALPTSDFDRMPDNLIDLYIKEML